MRPLTQNCPDDPCSRIDDSKEDAPNFGTLPRAAWLLLGGSRDLALSASFLLCQKFNSSLKLFSRRLHGIRLRWPQSGGSRRFCTRRLGGSRRFRTIKPGNIRSNKLGICPRATFNQLPLHLFILGVETGANT